MIITQRLPGVKQPATSFHGISADGSFGFWDYLEHESVGISIPSSLIGKMVFDEDTAHETDQEDDYPAQFSMTGRGVFRENRSLSLSK